MMEKPAVFNAALAQIAATWAALEIKVA